MQNIISPQTAGAVCPAWCAGHLGTSPDLTHISRDQVIPTAAPTGEREQAEVYVSVEQETGSAVPAVRLAGAADTPMHPAQAFQIGVALISAAFAGLTGREVSR